MDVWLFPTNDLVHHPIVQANHLFMLGYQVTQDDIFLEVLTPGNYIMKC